MQTFNLFKNLWYDDEPDGSRVLKENGLDGSFLYESNIPPLLRFFHINKISPSGWIEIESYSRASLGLKKSSCSLEIKIPSSAIIPLPQCNDLAPFKICSFDIEASSSHGDFPVPVKSYKKLATNLVDHCSPPTKENIFHACMDAFFGDSDKYQRVFPIEKVTEETVALYIDELFERVIVSETKSRTIESYFERQYLEEEKEMQETDALAFGSKSKGMKPKNQKINIIEILENMTEKREHKIIRLTSLLDIVFPKLQGDEVTFIGSTFVRFGEQTPYLENCIVLGTCDKREGIEINCQPTERDVLLEWKNLIQREDPDIIIGYNIFGFDYSFLFYRAKENGCLESFLRLSRNKDEICCSTYQEGLYKLDETVNSLASGQYELKYIRMIGRIQIDLYNVFRREENLTSYKLDYVAGHFIGDYISKIEDGNKVYCRNMTGLTNESFVHFDEDEAKHMVTSITEKYFTIRTPITYIPKKWGLAKDDVSPQDIFRMARESDSSRFLIAKYCLQDCNLLHYLMRKIDVLTGYIEMAAICSVPISFLVFRGQGIKLTSYVAKKCREMNTLMKVLPPPLYDDEGYEGATVLEPKCNLYLETPVACVDYASLYPSSMISENLSHDTKIWTKEFNLNSQLIKETGTREYDDTIKYVDVVYDTYSYVRKSETSKAEKVKKGYKVCRFAQNIKGIMPLILEDLLHARKSTRALQKLETDQFMKNVLDKRQLGYKVTANSLYGQCGAKTSTFYDKDIAASTTATGRMLLIYAKTLIETVYKGSVRRLKSGIQVQTNAEYIYGDTDSVFFAFNLTTIEGKDIKGQEALEITIELAQEAGELASKFLKSPHDLEYEKTFMPFCLLSKKRYVGMLYELDPTKCKRKEMGVVSKRRDNAPIVKDIYNGIIDILMKEKDIKSSVEFLKTCLKNIRQTPIQKLIISKSLRSDYKNPDQIAHKVLADRITLRDPGNKPNSGDRIPYVYIVKEKSCLQGDRIETPKFILENNLKIDYSFYITNQIMKPVQQVFALVLEDILILSKKTARLKNFQHKAKTASNVEKLRNEEIQSLLFDPFLQESRLTLTSFYPSVIK